MPRLLAPAPIIAALLVSTLGVLGIAFSTLAYARSLSPASRRHAVLGSVTAFLSSLLNIDAAEHLSSFIDAVRGMAATDGDLFRGNSIPFPTLDLLIVSTIIFVLATISGAIVIAIVWRGTTRSASSNASEAAKRNNKRKPVHEQQQQQQQVVVAQQEQISVTVQQQQTTQNQQQQPPRQQKPHPSVVIIPPGTDIKKQYRQVATALKLYDAASANNNGSNNTTGDLPKSFTADALDRCFTTQMGWQFQNTKHNGIRYYSRSSPLGSAVAASLFTVFIPGGSVTAQDVQLVLDDLSSHYKFDTLLAKRTLIRRDPTNAETWRNEMKSPVFMVAPRDVVTERVGFFMDASQLSQLNLDGIATLRDGGRAWGLFAEDASLSLPADSKYTRAKMLSAMVLAMETTASDTGTDGVLMVSHASVDPQGNLPAMVVNATLAAGFDRVRLQRALVLSISNNSY